VVGVYAATCVLLCGTVPYPVLLKSSYVIGEVTYAPLVIVGIAIALLAGRSVRARSHTTLNDDDMQYAMRSEGTSQTCNAHAAEARRWHDAKQVGSQQPQ